MDNVRKLAPGEWIGQHANAALIGNSDTGKTHLAVELGLFGNAVSTSPRPMS